MKPRVAIVIVNYRTAWHLNQCLKSIWRYTDDFKVIVVHNKPDSRSLSVTKKYQQQYPAQIEVIVNAENLGFVAGVNSAFELATGHERICLLNSDTLVSEDWLTELNVALDLPGVVQVAPDSNQFYQDGIIWRLIRSQLIPRWPALGYRLQLLQYYLRPPRSTQPERGFAEASKFYQFPGGFCYLVKSEHIKPRGFILDPNIKHGYWDDNEMGLYMRGLGQVGATNRAYVFHFVNVSLNKISPQGSSLRSRLIQYNAFYVIDKWHEVIAAELAKLSVEELLSFARESDVVRMYLEYFALAQLPGFTDQIRKLPAVEIGKQFLK